MSYLSVSVLSISQTLNVANIYSNMLTKSSTAYYIILFLIFTEFKKIPYHNYQIKQ